MRFGTDFPDGGGIAAADALHHGRCGGVFLLRKTGEPATRRMLCGMAAGIMLAASVWSLLLPAIERAEQGPLPAWVPPAVGLLLGAVGLCGWKRWRAAC